MDWWIQTNNFDIQTLSRRTRLSRTTIYRHLRGETVPRTRDREDYARAMNFTSLELFDLKWKQSALPADFVPKHSLQQGESVDVLDGADQSGLSLLSDAQRHRLESASSPSELAKAFEEVARELRKVKG